MVRRQKKSCKWPGVKNCCLLNEKQHTVTLLAFTLCETNKNVCYTLAAQDAPRVCYYNKTAHDYRLWPPSIRKRSQSWVRLPDSIKHTEAPVPTTKKDPRRLCATHVWFPCTGKNSCLQSRGGLRIMSNNLSSLMIRSAKVLAALSIHHYCW